MAASPPPPRSSERGFVLITALWLLILCGAIAALLLARSLTAAKAVSEDAAALRDKLALDGAIETAAADLLINGRRSVFALVPAERVLEVGGQSVRVRVEAESGKIDVNQADPALIDRALAGLGWDSGARALFLQRLEARRRANAPLRSTDELTALERRSAPTSAGSCAANDMTVYSGRVEPDVAFIRADLAARLGRPAPVESAPIGSGTPLRIGARTVSGSRSAVLRLSGSLDQAVVTTAWGDHEACHDQ